MAVKRSVLRATVLFVVSLGLYRFYWFYVTRKQLTAELGTDDNVPAQTLGLVVPILNISIVYWLWRDINIARDQVSLEEFELAIYLVLSVLGLAFIFYPLVAWKLNEYWDRRSGGRATSAPFTLAEGLVGIVPGVLYAIVAALVVIVAAGSGAGVAY